jgi:outer membrane protein TolC
MFSNSYKLWLGILLLVLFSNPIAAQNRDLDYYLNEGLTNSPLLKDYQNQVAANNIDSQRIRATFRPQVTGTSNNTISPIINGYGYDAVLSNQQSFNEFINVNQAFVGSNNLNTQYKAIHLIADSARNGQKITEQDLKRTIISQYITAYGDLQQLNFYTQVNGILKNQEIILKKLTQNNIYRQTDYLTFLVTMKQQELQIKQLKIQYGIDYATLNYVCGIFDTSSGALDPPDITLHYLPDQSSSAFFLRFKIDSARLANEAAILKYSYRPKLSAFVNAGYSSTLLYEAYKNFGVGAGINLNVPIYDGHQRALQEKKIHLLENTSINYKDFFTRQYTQQTAMLRQQLAATESLISDINEQIALAEGLINVNGKLLETGDAKIVDFVIAINNFLSAKNILTQNTISRMQVINQLNYWNR